jgi:hypothetical protein
VTPGYDGTGRYGDFHRRDTRCPGILHGRGGAASNVVCRKLLCSFTPKVGITREGHIYWHGRFERRISDGAVLLRAGGEYSVLQIFAQADGANKLRIEYSALEHPGLFDSRLFEISSDEIPRGWRVSRNWNGSLTFGPEEWTQPNFWEAFMNDEEWAIELYSSGRSKSLD